MYDVRGLPAGILVRISDDREGLALGVKRQEDDGRHLADRLGVDVVKVYIENDISASAIAGNDRQDFEDFLADWQAGVFKVPLAYTTGRLTRDNIVAERVIQTAKQTGMSPIYVASPWCDLNTAAGRRMYRSLAVNDAAEAEDIQERVQRKKNEDAEMGMTSGGPRTYGYGKVIGYDPKKGKDICDPYQVREDEVTVLQEGKERTLAGDSQLMIVRDWNARGVKTAKAGQVIRRKGKPDKVCDGLWTVGKFKEILLKECYVIFDPAGHPEDCKCLRNPETSGTRVHHNERHRAMWPGIFTPEDHAMLKTIFDRRQHPWGNHEPVKGRTYLLSGITYCGKCGGAMYGQGKKQYARGKKDQAVYRRRYACKKWDGHGVQVGCSTVFRIADPIETLVTELVLARFDSSEVARALAPAANEVRVNELVQQIAKLERRKADLAAEHAIEPYEDYRTMVATLKAQIEVATAELNGLRAEKLKSLAIPALGGLRDLWANASLEWRHSVIRLVVEKIVIHPGRPGERNWRGWNFDPELIEIVWLH